VTPNRFEGLLFFIDRKLPKWIVDDQLSKVHDLLRQFVNLLQRHKLSEHVRKFHEIRVSQYFY
jgi:hypothetical protein